MERVKVAFFDIGDTLGKVRLSAAGNQIQQLDVFSYVPDVLQQMAGADVRLGIISNRGNVPEENVRQVLELNNIYHYFEPALIIYGSKDSVEIFIEAATTAGHAENRKPCLFVGENPGERDYAAAAGLRVAKHPVEASTIVQSSNIRNDLPNSFLPLTKR